MTVIVENDILLELCNNLCKSRFVAVDTEFMRENTFWSKLCLIQLASPNYSAVVDPLAEGIDLTPIDNLMDNQNILKIFHAGRQDLEIFFNRTGRLPAPLFDTQIAAMVCGFGDAASYESLASTLAGTKIDKSLRFTDWSKRPLSDKQIRYAHDDVVHMVTIYEKLEAHLNNSNRNGWINEEMSKLKSVSNYTMKPLDAWKRIKIRNPTSRSLAILREVAAWRETEAQTRDLPRNRIIRDESLVEIASHPPKNSIDLKNIRGIPKALAGNQRSSELFKAIKYGLSIPDKELPKINTNGTRKLTTGPLVDLLKVLLKLCCEEHKVAQRMVANATELQEIAFDDDANVPALRGWRYEIFGRDALDLKNGRTSITVEKGKILIIRQDN